MSKVLVTGGSGFVGGHAIVQLLAAGYDVRTTLRSTASQGKVQVLADIAGAGDRLSVAIAALDSDAGWSDAVAGCDYVLHVASPFPASAPKDDDELVRPAREGTLRVLRAARDARVKRVVLTSSFAAIGYGYRERKEPFTEADWTEVSGSGITPYVRSKTVAERAAWDWMAREGGDLELAVINPVGIFGPLLSPHVSTSIGLVKRMLDGAMRGCPRLFFGVVDVRDVADIHIRAMTHPGARNERFIAAAGEFVSMFDIARILRERMGAPAQRVPRRELPDWLVRLAALRDPAVRSLLPELGKLKSATNEKARKILEWHPRPNDEAIVTSAQSLSDLGLLAR